MIDPVTSRVGRAIGLPPPAGRPAPPGAAPDATGGFAGALRRELEKVSGLQSAAEQGVQDLLTGRTQNLAEVFTAARKAEVAFSLLMEIRNKLTDAYLELKRMQV